MSYGHAHRLTEAIVSRPSDDPVRYYLETPRGIVPAYFRDAETAEAMRARMADRTGETIEVVATFPPARKVTA